MILFVIITYILDPENKIDEILGGDYHSPDIDIDECVEWLYGTRQKEGIEATELEVNLDRFKEFIRTTKESKRSSPSGRH